MENRLFNVLTLSLTAVAVAPVARELWHEYQAWLDRRVPAPVAVVEHPEFRAAWRSVCDDLRAL